MTKKRSAQIHGFMRCLNEFSRITFNRKEYSNSKQRKSFKDLFRDIELVDMPKVFKGLLAFTFSVEMQQEIPDVPVKRNLFEIFPQWRRMLEQRKRTSKSYPITSSKHYKDVTSLWNLLQCKGLAADVPKDMILESYEKHSKILTKETTTDPILLKKLDHFIKPYLQTLEKVMTKPVNIPLPNRSSTLESNRASDGNLGYHIQKNLKHGKSLVPFARGSRIDPVVIHIMGKPGIGKSYSVKKIVEQLTAKFSLSPDDVYYRNAHTEHWDGYKQQLITVIDDFNFQVTNTTSELPPELNEFLTLKSDCEYYLPMAHLSQKGTRFTSKFLIITSNQGVNIPNKFVEPGAFLRRLDSTYVMKDGKFHFYDVQLVLNNPQLRNACSTDMVLQSRPNSDFTLSEITERAFQRYLSLERVKPSLDVFTECKYGGVSMRLDLDLELPEQARVKAHAIPEPLKVRMITIGTAKNWPLKVVQLKMFEALRDFSIFSPCWDNKIEMEIDFQKDNIFLSGDYSNATDGLHWEVSQLILNRIGEVVQKKYPLLSELYQLESGHHVVDYPSWTKIPSIIQTNGQLMGSLLSFPVLCLANAFTLTSLFKDYHLGKAVPAKIHGDDLLAYIPKDRYPEWKKLASNIGLEPSLGKNYTDPHWGSIDSQVFHFNGKGISSTCTGKFSLFQEVEDPRSAIRTLQEKGYSIPKIRRHCQHILDKLPFQSLDIDWKDGGLRMSESIRPLERKELLVKEYFSKNSNRISRIGFNTYQMPKRFSKTLPKSTVVVLEDKCESKAPKDVNAYVRSQLKTKRELHYDRLPVVQEHDLVFSQTDLTQFSGLVKTSPQLFAVKLLTQNKFSTDSVKPKVSFSRISKHPLSSLCK